MIKYKEKREMRIRENKRGVEINLDVYKSVGVAIGYV
jgi:hypothetical protein